MIESGSDGLARRKMGKYRIAVGLVLLAAVAGAFALASKQMNLISLPMQESFAQVPTESSKASSAQPLKEAALPVEGMSCAACAARVKGTLKKMNGVAQVEVNLVKRTVGVRYSPEKVTPQQLVATINKLGYKARLPAESKTKEAAAKVKTVVIDVDGMVCEFCAQTVEEKVRSTAGVSNVRISLKDKAATVEYDEGKVTPKQLAEQVDSAGFKAKLPESKDRQ